MKRWTVPIGFVVVLGCLIAWRLTANHAAAAAQSAGHHGRGMMTPAVSVAPATIRDIELTFGAVGSVEAPISAKIAPKSTGQVLEVDVHEGDRVTRGEVLVKIDPSEARASVAQQEANVAQAKQRLAQAEMTQNPTDVSIATAIRQQQATLASAQSDYGTARSNAVSQVAAAEASVTDAQAKVTSAQASVANATAGLESAKANLANAKAKYARQQSLFDKGFVAKQTLDDARTAVDVQKAAVDVAKAQLNGATASLASTKAQLRAAQQQVAIVKATGTDNVASASAKVAEARAAVASAEANIAQKPAYEENLDALRSAVSAAQAQLEDAQAVLAQTTLRSPIDGYVTARYMDPGSVATAGQAVLAVQQINPVWITVPIPEENANKVYVGQTAQVSLDAVPGRKFNGKVSEVDPSADPSSRQFSVRITLDNPKNEIKPGMFGHVSLVTSRINNALTVPREAVHQTDTGATVDLVNADNTIAVTPVTLGATDAAGFQIMSGLHPGDKVVVMTASPLHDGQQIKLAGPGDDGHGGHHHHR